ncbi:hypothetical protein IMAU60057_00657 [Lactiplantibacillus plantarum]|nr:hypothetical protein [Lactiplantibacillus plantarum]
MIVDVTEDTDKLKKLYEDIRVDKGYRKIVNNENFNPRLIEQISRNWRRVSDNDNFLTYILSVLNNPKDLYNELFEKLSDAEKKFLLVLNSFEHFPMKLSFVENSFQNLDLSSVVDVKVIEERLESSWVIFRLTGSDTFIDFANPSIVDYFNKKVKGMLTVQSQILENSATLIQLYNSKTSLFKQEIVNDFYRYPDRIEFIGERIHYADLDKEEFSKLVKAFTIDKQPYFDSRLSKYGWSELIKDIQEFEVPLQQLFVDNIFRNELGFIDEDSADDDFESNLRAIQDVSKKVYGDQGKLQSHEKFYNTLQDAIFDNIQEKIDESDFVYDLTEQMGGVNSYDEGEYEDSFRKELQDNVSVYVQNMINEFDFSDGIRDGDFDLEELGERVIENMSESDELDYELGNRYQEHGNFDNGSDLVDDILDKPLD